MHLAIVCCVTLFLPLASGHVLRGTGPANTSGKVFFLFMADGELPHEDIWERFFAPARQGADFHAFVHCQNRSRCQRSIRDKKLFRIVETVASDWCSDLVAPMNHLLTVALQQPGSDPGDKFAFVSDTTVPIKSFAAIRQRLLIDDRAKSSFCVNPQSVWGLHNSGDLAVKHDQWLTLSRHHALAAVTDYLGPSFIRELRPITVDSVVSQFQRTAPFLTAMVGKLAPDFVGGVMHVRGCLDEYMHFNLAFGLVNASRSEPIDFTDLSGGPLALQGHAAEAFQGRCDTYLLWGRGGNFSEVSLVLSQDPLTVYSHSEESLHPATFVQLSGRALVTLRDSVFLFSRKLNKETAFADANKSLGMAFEEFVFSSDRPLSSFR